MNKPIIILSRQLPELFTQALEQITEIRLGGPDVSDRTLQGASVYLATGIDPVPEPLISRFPPELGLIANIATGTDNIDINAAAAKGIAVSNTPVVAEDTADLTMGLLIATCRQMSFCERALRMKEWDTGMNRLGNRVFGKTLGIVGMGAIGQALAHRASGFDMRVIYHGPNRKLDAEKSLGVEYRESLNDLLAESDIVSLNCPLTANSHHLLNANNLALMKPGSILINTGRGKLIDEQALVQALASGHLGGAGLDVFEFEPDVSPELLTFDNVTLLPHIGGATSECRMDMAIQAFANVQQFLNEGHAINNCI